MSRPLGVPRKVDRRRRETVPRTVVDLLELDPGRRAAAGAAFRQLGANLEVDVAALDDVAPGLGARCREYFLAARDLWDDLDQGRAGDPMVLVRVPLIDARQSDTRAGRVDLDAAVQALTRTPATRQAALLLDASPDWDALSTLGTVTRDGERSTLEVRSTDRLWPLELGGPAAPGERLRVVRLEANHAAWRDRRTRRLVRVRVDAHQVWPDPAPFRRA